MSTKKYTQVIDGKEFVVELNNWAEQASGSVLVRLGDTVVLATAVMNKNPREGGDFFPLTVDYEEKFYATGKILGSRFVKRETRPSEEAILAGRFIDRSIRPRFDMRMRNEVQVVITVLSIDGENDPDIPALTGASLALGLSDIPWSGPVAGVRIGRAGGSLLVNPRYAERTGADLDLVVSGIKERINMIEAGANEISEEDFLSAVEKATKFIKEVISFQEKIIAEHGRTKKTVALLPTPEEVRSLLHTEFAKNIEHALYQPVHPHTNPDSPSSNNQHPFGVGVKKEQHASLDEIKKKFFIAAAEKFPEQFIPASGNYLFDEVVNDIIHRRIIEKGERPDGRKTNEIRPLSAAVALLPRVHGSGLFMRGETHVLSTLTLGAPGDEQIIEGMEIQTKKHFLHHYNFPPFSVGETKPLRGPGRREIGHGALAGKAILPLLPPKEEFPYTIRIVSEVLSSNGSSSMASVCGSSLALMDAGVPIKKSAGGAAMGLMLNEKGQYKVLTDIQGPEDHHGDMDFKVAGTRDGITAVQMDVKIEGITVAMMRDTLAQTKEARFKILDTIDATISRPRENLSPWAPRIVTLKINPEKIGALIGPGGKVINDIIAKTGTQIDIEDDGTVFITSTSGESMDQAVALVKQVTKEIKPGELLEGKVTRILDFGAMVELGPRQDGLIHVSELAPWHVEKVTDIINIGDVVPVKVRNIDEQGRINLSLKDVPGRYSEEEIARGREERARMPFKPQGGRRPGRPRY